jgi:hypothetical protein
MPSTDVAEDAIVEALDVSILTANGSLDALGEEVRLGSRRDDVSPHDQHVNHDTVSLQCCW